MQKILTPFKKYFILCTFLILSPLTTWANPEFDQELAKFFSQLLTRNEESQTFISFLKDKGIRTISENLQLSSFEKIASLRSQINENLGLYNYLFSKFAKELFTFYAEKSQFPFFPQINPKEIFESPTLSNKEKLHLLSMIHISQDKLSKDIDISSIYINKFIVPNELTIGALRDGIVQNNYHLLPATKPRLLVAVGSERALLDCIASNCEELFIYDLDPGIVLYHQINTKLIKHSDNHTEYLNWRKTTEPDLLPEILT